MMKPQEDEIFEDEPHFSECIAFMRNALNATPPNPASVQHLQRGQWTQKFVYQISTWKADRSEECFVSDRVDVGRMESVH